MKKFLCLVVTLSVLISSSPVFAGSDYEINNLDTLKQEVSETFIAPKVANNMPASDKIQINEKKVEQIISETNPAVLSEFLDEKINLAEEITANLESSLDSSGVTEDYYDLGDGCYIKITLEDRSTDSTENHSSDFSTYANTPGAETVWEKYGNRSYTVKYELFILLVWYELTMVTDYTLNDNGITNARADGWINWSGIASGTRGNVNLNRTSAGIGQTVTANTIFTMYVGVDGIGITKSFRMYNNVKCSDIDKVARDVKLVKSWNGTWL